MSELGGAQEPRQSALLDRWPTAMRVVCILPEIDVEELLVGEARLLAVVELDLAIRAVETARPDMPVLPDPVPQQGAQRMQRLGISHRILQCPAARIGAPAVPARRNRRGAVH